MYKFIVNEQTVEWGTLYHIMESHGNGYIRAYVYNDQPCILYLSDLNVQFHSRKKGLGTALLEYVHTLGNLGRVYSVCLATRKGSWQHKWYKRLGYEKYAKHENKGYIWMSKWYKEGLLKQIENTDFKQYTQLSIESINNYLISKF